MFEVIKSDDGKEFGEFEFDYLGEYPDLDLCILNAKIKLYEKGLYICTSLSANSLFIKWDSVKAITFTNTKPMLVSIMTDEAVIKLKKEKEQTNISDFKSLLNQIIPEIKIKDDKELPDNLCSISLKRAQKRYEEQQQRVDEFIRKCEAEKQEIEDAWEKHLKDKLQFPFQAEIIDDPGPMEVGDIIKVYAVDGTFDPYGIVVKARLGRKQYSFPVCLLEVVDNNSENYQLVDDYNFWFANQ